jgi:hypothetical protein
MRFRALTIPMLVISGLAGCATDADDVDDVDAADDEETPYAGCWQYDAYGPSTNTVSLGTYVSEQVCLSGGHCRTTYVKEKSTLHPWSIDWYMTYNDSTAHDHTNGRVRIMCEKLSDPGNPSSSTSINQYVYTAWRATGSGTHYGDGCNVLFPNPDSTDENTYNWRVWYANPHNRYRSPTGSC